MTLPYKRSFEKGRQSDILLNDDMHKAYESIRHISEQTSGSEEPELKLHGALWRDDATNELKYCDKTTNKWTNVFSSKFQITEHMLEDVLPSNPIAGQLWIHDQVLYFFDGSQWSPVKASVADDSQFSQGAFDDFVMVTPLLGVGNNVAQVSVDDDFIEHYYNDNADYKNKKQYLVTDEKWSPDWTDPFTEPSKTTSESLDTKTQFILPSVKYDRFFIDRTLCRDYEKVSSVCLQYPTKNIVNTTESAVHLNAGKITNIVKRLVKVDKQNPTIKISAYNTEFYGFTAGSRFGDFLIQSDTTDNHDYITVGSSIILNYKAAQNYDYVLAVTYEFGWIRDTGSEKIISGTDVNTGYFIDGMVKPVSVFVDGLQLEDRYYTANADTSSVMITDTSLKPDKQSVDFLNDLDNEFGYIRDVSLEGYGIVKLKHQYGSPLIFINGQCMNATTDHILSITENGVIVGYKVEGAKINMPWCIIDLDSDKLSNWMYHHSGVVGDNDASVTIANAGVTDNIGSGTDTFDLNTGSVAPDGSLSANAAVVSTDSSNYISYANTPINPADGVILFVDGLLISQKDIIRNYEQYSLTITGGLKAGQSYMLIRDPGHKMYDNMKLLPALTVDRLDSAMIYLDGKLLCDNSPINELSSEKEIAKTASDGEIKFFITDQLKASGIMKVYSSFHNTWSEVSAVDIANIQLICGSYEQAISSIKLNIDYSNANDFCVYSFKFANTISDVLKVGDAVRYSDDNPDYYSLADQYISGKRMLNIFVNGAKQIEGVDYKETDNGKSIRIVNKSLIRDNAGNLLDPRVTYIIEPLEDNSTQAATVVTLTADNSTAMNIYRIPDTNAAEFYPGRLTVYVNGVRVAKENWTLLGNKTIMLNKQKYPLVSKTSNNFPIERYADGANYFDVTHKQQDVVTVEIRQEYTRKEITIDFDGVTGTNEFGVDEYNIPSTILESKDEVLIFINGIFTGLTKRNSNSYKIDTVKGCLSIQDAAVLEQLHKDPLWNLMKQNDNVYTAWKIMNNKTAYTPKLKSKITIVWR